MRYDVRLRTFTGTTRLYENPLRWEREVHDVTWTTCESLEEAAAVVKDLAPEKNPALLEVWVEPRTDPPVIRVR
jgi:hypothetical protein